MEAKKILKSRISSSVSWTTGTNHQRLSPRHRCFTARREVHITNTSDETLLSQAVPKAESYKSVMNFSPFFPANWSLLTS